MCIYLLQGKICKTWYELFQARNYHNVFLKKIVRHLCSFYISSLQCFSVLSEIWVKIELCIPLESESSVLSTCNAFACLSPPSKLKFAGLFCSICEGLISFGAILF